MCNYDFLCKFRKKNADCQIKRRRSEEKMGWILKKLSFLSDMSEKCRTFALAIGLLPHRTAVGMIVLAEQKAYGIGNKKHGETCA